MNVAPTATIDDQDDEVRERDRGAAVDAAAPLDPADERIEGEREEERDHHPREDVPRDPDHLERDPDGQDDQQDSQDRARTQIDNALRRHRSSITRASDVVPCRR